MSSPAKQLGVYATKTAKTTSNVNTPSSKDYLWFLIAYSALMRMKQYDVQGFSKRQRSFSAQPLLYLTSLA